MFGAISLTPASLVCRARRRLKLYGSSMKANVSNRLLGKDRLFSASWVRIVQSRFLLCLVIALYTVINPDVEFKERLWIFIITYLVFNVSLGLLNSEILSLKRVKVIPAVIDVVFITLLCHTSTRPDSSWFLFYLFPVISVSRYLEYSGTLSIAGFSIAAYLFTYLASAPPRAVDAYTFTLRCMVLVGMAAVAGNLAKARQREQEEFTKFLEEVDQAMLSNVELERVLRRLLKRGLEFTNSEMGHIRLLDSETQEYKIAAVIGHPEGHDWATMPFDETYSRIVVNEKEPLIVPQIKKGHLRRKFGSYFRYRRPRPKSALFVPLILKEAVFGVIAVYSRWRYHYTKIDARRLSSFASLIEMAIKKDVARERHERLVLLNEIGEKLRSSSAPDLFRQVVALTIRKLNSEEAALFIRSEADKNRIEKVEVCSPDPGIIEKLRAEETSYLSGESLTGVVFESQRPYRSNNVSPGERYGEVYGQLLPSGKVKHYLGVPLVIENEVLGVIRVLNKRSAESADAKQSGPLADGFKKEDEELMQSIASLVAPEIRSAERLKKLVEARKYYLDLIVHHSPDPIIVLNEQGEIVIFNQACVTLWGRSYEKSKGKPVEEFYESPEHAKEIGRLLWKTEGHRIESIDARIKNVLGEVIPISLSASLLFEDGKHVGSIGVFKDLRAFERREAELLQATKLATLGILARTTWHDIKHSIITARNYINTLLFKCDREREPKLFAVYNDVQEALQEAMDELQDLMVADKSRPLRKAPWGVNDLFRTVEGQLRRKAQDGGVELHLHHPENDCALLVDVEQLGRVFSNLFTNSLDAIEKRRQSDGAFRDGRIDLSACINGERARLLWQDDGCGIAEKDRGDIFNAFFTTKGADRGSGLGLHIVKTIVEGHGGQVTVESEPGLGTRFEMTLPILKDEGRAGENRLAL
jgi:PAS domain S-box-containing protein